MSSSRSGTGRCIEFGHHRNHSDTQRPHRHAAGAEPVGRWLRSAHRPRARGGCRHHLHQHRAALSAAPRSALGTGRVRHLPRHHRLHRRTGLHAPPLWHGLHGRAGPAAGPRRAFLQALGQWSIIFICALALLRYPQFLQGQSHQVMPVFGDPQQRRRDLARHRPGAVDLVRRRASRRASTSPRNPGLRRCRAGLAYRRRPA